MANRVPDQRTVLIPPDAGFLAGLPVAGSGIRNLAGALRWAYEAITGGIAPGETSLTLDGSEEWLRPHDHSGLVGSIMHGAFVGQSGTLVFHRGAADPVASWPTGWEWDQDGIEPDSPLGAGMTFPVWSSHYGYGYWCHKYNKAYNAGTANNAAFCGLTRIHVRRGTNVLHIRQGCVQVDNGAGLTPGEIHWATMDTSGSIIDSDSATLDNTQTPTTPGYDQEQTGTLYVATGGATLTVDTDIYVWCGLKALDTSGTTKTLILADSATYYTDQV